MKILLVDDAEDIRSTMHDYLELFYNDISITEACNGEEALNHFNQETFDVIITDEMMPIMRGSQFIQEAYERIVKDEILTMVFSGQLLDELKQQFSSKPEIMVMDKVSDPMELKSIIDTKVLAEN